MSTTEELHKLVDELSEKHLEEVRDFIQDLNTPAVEETLAPETRAAIEEGLKASEQGNTMSVEEYKRSQ